MPGKAKPIGRPSTYSEETVSQICAALASGKSLRTVCAQEGMPELSTVFLWLSKHQSFSEQYAKARSAQQDAMVEEIIAIADDTEANKGATGKARLQVETRKWLMSKLAPKKFGEKITTELTGPDGGAVAIDIPPPPKTYEEWLARHSKPVEPPKP